MKQTFYSLGNNSKTSSRVDALEAELRLKSSDVQFLQDELEKKDKMLTMLTDGLREVQSLYLVDSVISLLPSLTAYE